MGRAHIHGYDTNAAQFERAGNPWDGDGILRKTRRKGRRKVRDFQTVKRLNPRESREGNERIAEINFWAGFDARRGARTRTIAPQEKTPTLAKIEPLTREVKPARSTEMRMPSRWQLFEGKVQQAVARGKREAAEAAWRSSEAAKREEKRRLQSIIQAAQTRLASL